MNTNYIKPEIKVIALDSEKILDTWSADKGNSETTVDTYLGKGATFGDDSDWDE